jgi:Protein of unknown function (DUF2889)
VTAPVPDLPPAPRTAVHRRSIIMDSYRLDDEHVTVAGRLTDVQPWGGPGHEVIHDMTLTVTVRLADLVITDPFEETEQVIGAGRGPVRR